MTEAAQDEVRGLLDELGKLLPPLGVPDVAVYTDETTDPNYTPVQLLAAFNYMFVMEDQSMGVHNFMYTISLLETARRALTAGDLGAGFIASVTDVPNDQGKQIRMIWTRFGADGPVQNPVQFYAMWRRVDDQPTGSLQKERPRYESLDLVPTDPAEIAPDAQIYMSGHLWDFVGTVPASSQEQYSAIAPTLFDSTNTDGMRWSVFRVSGHTANPAEFAMSAPDSGYSVDNLAPAAPTNLTGSELPEGISLTWDDAIDEDFNYFALYRSTTSGFDPATMEPLAELTETSYVDSDVAIGATYYYRLSAFDFAGNQGDFTDEYSFLVTSVEGAPNAIPDNYALNQNYPNPFNPTTTIQFALKEAGHVTMVLYNAIGEEVMKLIDEEMPAGNHRAQLSAVQLSTGVYFYRISVNEFSAVKKMIVMK